MKIHLMETSDRPPLRGGLVVTVTPLPTCRLGGPAPPGLVEGGHSPDGGPQNAPAEHGHRVVADELAHEGPVAAPQQRHDVRTHVVRVFLTEILRDLVDEDETLGSASGTS